MAKSRRAVVAAMSLCHTWGQRVASVESTALCLTHAHGAPRTRRLAGINGLSRRVELPAALGGGPALGADRPTSGVCGDPIRAAGLDFVASARQVRPGPVAPA